MTGITSCQSDKQMKADIAYKAWQISTSPKFYMHDILDTHRPWLSIELKTPEDLSIAKGLVAAEPSCTNPTFTMDYLDICSKDVRETPEWKNYKPIPATTASYGKLGYTASECIISESKGALTRARSFGMQSNTSDKYETLPSYTLIVIGRISGDFCWISVAFGKFAGTSGYVNTEDIRERYIPANK